MKFSVLLAAYTASLACGNPIVATQTGGAAQLVNDQNGLLVPTGNVEALAAAMQQMRQHFHRYDPAVIRADCMARFSDEALVRQLEEVYRQAIDRRTNQTD